MAHTLHLHGTHDSKNDGAFPLILPNQTYNYNFIAEPAGSFLYHCHAPPTSLHIRMGMYGSLIIDPKDPNILKPAREYALVLSEFDPKDLDSFIPKYYPVNGYADQYMENNSLVARQNELVRFYVSNLGTTIPFPFHLHSTIFKVYQSGLLSNDPIDVQAISISPGDAIIVEAIWKYPGTYFVHSHGIQEERGNMGEIDIIPESGNAVSYTTAGTTTNSSSIEPVTNKSVSMIDWQYQMQKKLQKPLISSPHGIEEAEQATTAEAAGGGAEAAGATLTIPEGASVQVQGNPSYDPDPLTVSAGDVVEVSNHDTVPHTVTSGSGPEDPESGSQFDTSIIDARATAQVDTANLAAGDYPYYCSVHPYMVGTMKVS